MTPHERMIERFRHHIFVGWHYPTPWHAFAAPAPGYCLFIEFTPEEVAELRKVHDHARFSPSTP
jgi:hypothetical protein